MFRLLERYSNKPFKIRYWTALMHFIKAQIIINFCSVGTAYQRCGYLLAIPLTVFVAILTCHCQHLLAACGEFVEEELIIDEQLGYRPRRISIALARPYMHISESPEDEIEIDEEGFPHINYAYVVDYIFKKGNPVFRKSTDILRVITNVSICSLHLGVCSFIIDFVGCNAKEILVRYGISIDFHIMQFIFLIPMWLTSLLPSLRILATVSTVGNTAIVIFLFLFSIETIELPNFQNRQATRDIVTIPSFFFIMVPTFENMALILPLRVIMRNPSNMTKPFGILNITSFVNCFVLIFTGLLCYNKYGRGISDGPLVILDDTKTQNIMIVLLLINMIAAYPLHIFILTSVLWPSIKMRKGPFVRPLLAELIFRSSLVIFTLLFAEIVPYVDLVILLVCCLASPALTLYVPSLMDIVRRHRDLEGWSRLVLIKNMFIVAFALFLFIVGVYESAIGIHDR